jgi:small-conductance mechanosensitive channel
MIETTWLGPAIAASGGLALGLVVRRTVLPLLARAAAKSSWRYDDALIESVRNPIVVWFALGGVRLALRLLPIDGGTERLLGRVVLVAAVLSVTWALARFAGLSLRAGSRQGSLPSVSLIANVVRALIYVIGVLVLLQALGVPVTPLITALGVGGLAVGLALQDTLANFFAGIRILAADRIRIGDFVRLDSGEEGFIQDITWAQTTIRQTANSLVVVPNSKISSAIAINFDLPDREQAVIVPVGVSYGSDLEKVERVTVEVARALQAESPQGVRAFDPFIRYHQFGDSSINFNVILRATHHTDRFPLMHEFIKRLHRRYREEGIEIPFPQRDVNLRGGSPPPDRS